MSFPLLRIAYGFWLAIRPTERRSCPSRTKAVAIWPDNRPKRKSGTTAGQVEVLSPHPFCDLFAAMISCRIFAMSSPAATTSLPDDPALLKIEGAVATITLNRPAAFNSINLAIARKLEQLAADVEASEDIKVLVIEGEGKAFC